MRCRTDSAFHLFGLLHSRVRSFAQNFRRRSFQSMETEGSLSGAVETHGVLADACGLRRSLHTKNPLGPDETIRVIVDHGQVNEKCSNDGAIEFLHKFSSHREELACSAEEVDDDLCPDNALSVNTTMPPPELTLDNKALPTAVGTMATQTLEQLVNMLTNPGCATETSNEICTAIMLHPELLSSSSKLGMYSKMDGGLNNYVPGTAHAWLYTPKKRRRKQCNDQIEGVTTGFALIFAYPDSSRPSPGTEEAANAKAKLHFGGRSYPLCNNSVLLQHGGDKLLR